MSNDFVQMGVSMKSISNPWGIYRDQEVYESFAVVAKSVFLCRYLEDSKYSTATST